MNHLADPQKKTSIDQLLNPLKSVPHDPQYQQPHIPNINPSPDHHHDQHGVPPYPPQYSNPNAFNLRAANWEVSDDPNIRKPDNDANATRQYIPLPNSQLYDGHAHAARVVWQPVGDAQPVAYGHHQPVGPMYSDERTALSGDYQVSNGYHHPYDMNAAMAQLNEAYIAQRGPYRAVPPPDPARYAQWYPHGAMMAPVAYAPLQPPPPAPTQAEPQTQKVTQKRPLPESEDTSKQKKPKNKAKSFSESNTGPSRRGYNAKKRSEAAQIAAQSAQLMPTSSYANDKGKEKAIEVTQPAATANGSSQANAQAVLQTELQFARCMSNRYRSEQFPRCVSCTRRWAGDTCRFQGIRFFLKDSQRNIVGISFVESQKPDAPSMNFPTQWNISLKAEHIRPTKLTVARALLPTLRKEMEHLELPEVIRRPRESEVRATCDTCMTSIFSSTWMCRLCGREACEECYGQVRDLTMDRPGAGQVEIAALQARREKHAHSNPFFLSCTRRNEHSSNEFSPVSRFCKEELAQAIQAMEELVREEDNNTAASGGDVVNGNNGVVQEPSYVPNDQNIPQPYQPTFDGSDTPCYSVARIPDPQLTDDVFRSHWIKGEPLVVTGTLGKFGVQWTPEYFIEKYGGQSCLIIECQTEENKRTTVADFFKDFGKYEGRKSCWKLKDWPSSTEFKAAFPELYEDFAKAVPVPNYVRRDGVLNIASHFPSNTISPDLGPKMYNAFASTSAPGSKGTTRLHMDMADAVNIMTFAAPCANGDPGFAAWDLFRPEDSDKLRQFLRKKFKGAFQNDPIHAQQFYLDEHLRRELWETTAIKSFRIYQRPGEAVFIPAGCAHQVVNFADCVKVAIDFVSPENIARCEQLTREFREQNQSMVWKEDVLQLRTMMWFAWLSCCRQEQ